MDALTHVMDPESKDCMDLCFVCVLASRLNKAVTSPVSSNPQLPSKARHAREPALVEENRIWQVSIRDQTFTFCCGALHGLCSFFRAGFHIQSDIARQPKPWSMVAPVAAPQCIMDLESELELKSQLDSECERATPLLSHILVLDAQHMMVASPPEAQIPVSFGIRTMSIPKEYGISRAMANYLIWQASRRKSTTSASLSVEEMSIQLQKYILELATSAPGTLDHALHLFLVQNVDMKSCRLVLSKEAICTNTMTPKDKGRLIFVVMTRGTPILTDPKPASDGKEAPVLLSTVQSVHVTRSSDQDLSLSKSKSDAKSKPKPKPRIRSKAKAKAKSKAKMRKQPPPKEDNDHASEHAKPLEMELRAQVHGTLFSAVVASFHQPVVELAAHLPYMYSLRDLRDKVKIQDSVERALSEWLQGGVKDYHLRAEDLFFVWGPPFTNPIRHIAMAWMDGVREIVRTEATLLNGWIPVDWKQWSDLSMWHILQLEQRLPRCDRQATIVENAILQDQPKVGGTMKITAPSLAKGHVIRQRIGTEFVGPLHTITNRVLDHFSSATRHSERKEGKEDKQAVEAEKEEKEEKEESKKSERKHQEEEKEESKKSERKNKEEDTEDAAKWWSRLLVLYALQPWAFEDPKSMLAFTSSLQTTRQDGWWQLQFRDLP